MAAGARSIKAGEAFLELAIRDGAFRRGIDRAVSRLRTLGQSFKSIGSLGVAGGGLAGLQRALTLIAGSAAVTWPIKLAADMEVAEAEFTSMTGSAQKAQDVLRGLLVFSGRSTFSFDQLRIAARNMLQFGFTAEQLLPTMRDLAAVSVGDADKLDRLSVAFGQVQAKGRLMAEEVRQMVNAGFNPLQEIARTTGRSMQDLLKDMEAGKISAEQVRQAFASVVGPGGRFNNILELIQNTATGQFRKLLAGIKLVVLPLGQELLPAITGILKAINNLVPSIGQIVRENAAWAKVIAATAVGLSGLLAILFSTGVAIQVVAFAAGGLVTLFGLLVNPVTLVGAALAGLTALFVKFTNIGAAAFQFIATKLGDILDITVETFGAVADALAGGDLVAATNVAWAGIKLAWLTGTEELKTLWTDFKFFFLQNTTNLVFGALKVWEVFRASLYGIWEAMRSTAQTVGEQIGNALSRSDDPELAAEQDAASKVVIAQIEAQSRARQAAIAAELQARLGVLDQEARIAGETREADRRAAIAAAQAELAAAKKNFAAAKDAAQNAKPPGDPFGANFDAVLGGIPDLAGSLGIGARSTFSGKFAPQVFGAGGDNIPKQQLAQQKKTNVILDKINNNAFRNQGGQFIPVGNG